ncbi:LppU/SCO3897 family protein [Actinoplanes friuliensis]|uniref:Uncharacterized protein n=1 Tax=Actinoplanes friuliensis DSM 7358 TaxID=1246995 RepID=U5WC50_9ACTN|nr:hypothetical protein [Actinoplanes friuliensis]AGZ46793.1 hypothetical protein AFR_42695 [Actinoplanes friuliensis DSM 7358]
MSQNGPYPGQGWSAGGSSGSDEPYTEPADPWGDAATHSSPAPDVAWGGQPMSVPPANESSTGYHPYSAAVPNGAPPMWQPPPAAPLPPKRRNTPIIALVIVLGLLICGGLGTAAWLVQRGDNDPTAGRTGSPTASATTNGTVPEPQSSEDARFVAKGQCVRNEGNADDSPDLKIVSCASGTYEVLKRVDGRTTGEADAESKCGKVAKYTKWYFYDSELDSLDFVLCLKEYGVD